MTEQQIQFKRKINLNVLPDYDSLDEYCPRTASIAAIHNMSRSDEMSPLEDEFVFPENAQGKTPFYQFSRNEIRNINIATEQVYGVLVDSLDFLFDDKYRHFIPTFYGKDFIESYPEFVNYAIYTFKNNHESIYGRFDIAYDFEQGKVLKFYEGNLDTPTMLFDSVVMNNQLLQRVGDTNAQYNLQYENLARNVQRVVGHQSNKVAFLFDSRITEDCITTELLYSAFNESTNNICLLSDINNLRFDWEMNRPKFTLEDVTVDYIFALYPWEDMVVDFYSDSPNPLNEWRKWADHTRFLEPAWRWFVSNKGAWAWLTYLKDVLAKVDPAVAAYVEKYAEAWQYVIPTYMEKPESLKDYVKKPLQGRMSNNVQFYLNDELVHETGGYYAEDDFVYQEFVPTGSADGGNSKAIVCSWLAPWGEGERLDMESSGLAVREFIGEMLELKKERFMPHVAFGVDVVEHVGSIERVVRACLPEEEVGFGLARMNQQSSVSEVLPLIKKASEIIMSNENGEIPEAALPISFVCVGHNVTTLHELGAVLAKVADDSYGKFECVDASNGN